MNYMNQILNHEALKKLSMETFSTAEVEILCRQKSIIIKKVKEDSDIVTRIILLSPYGYSSNNLNELSSHNEVRRAKITVKGTMKEGKNNFSKIKNCLKMMYLESRDAITEGHVPYALVSDNEDIYREKVLSAKDSLYVVKENGEGFYHNLLNLSDSWLVLVLVKELRTGKAMDIESKTGKFTPSEKMLISKLIQNIEEYGDELFEKDPILITNILDFRTEKLIPVLIEALDIRETGRHEPCTVYALILKKAKRDTDGTLTLLKNSLYKDEAPIYYLRELIQKINRRRAVA